MAITTQNGAYADPNTNMGRELIKNERGDTYLTKHYSDGIGETKFGLPEWIPDGNGNYTPYIIMENPNTYVIENKYLPMSINKADCMTTLYLNNENILDGADTLMEKQYWEVYHKENETDNYQLLDTSTWDCETTFSSGNNFSIFTTWEKLHGYETLQSSQYDVTSTNSTGTYYFRTFTETTTTPNVVTGQTTITNSTGTFTIDVIEDVTETTTTNIPVIPNEIKSEFQVEYRYMLDDSEVESFTRITNNDVNLENHYFQFVNKLDGVNYDAFNLGDDIEFTDDSYIGTYTASAENVPQKYINIAEQGYPLYYSLEKGEEWWESASATIYMDGAEKKLNVQVDFGKDREPLALNTMQELDPTWTSGSGTVWRADTANSTGASCPTSANYWASNSQSVRVPQASSNDACTRSAIEFDTSGLDNSYVVTDADLTFSTSTAQSTYNCSFTSITTDDLSALSQADSWSQLDGDGTVYLDNDSSCQTTGSHTVDLGTTADGHIQNSSLFSVGIKATSESRPSGSSNIVIGSLSSTSLTVTYELPTVTGAPTSLSATGASTSQIDLSWTAPDTSSATIPAVSGYRIQSSDFAFANSSLPTGRTADADVYGAITGGVDMDTAQLYLSMNTTQDVAGSGLVFNNDYTDASWVDNNLGGSYGDATVGTSSIDLDVTNTSTSNYPHNSRNFELDSALSNEWVMRYAFTINSKGTTLGNAFFNVMLIDDKWLGGGWDSANENAGNGDFISAMYHVHTSDNKWGYATADNFTHSQTTSKTGISYGVGETHYFELRRTSATAISVDYHGQSGFGTATDTATASIASSIANLDTIAIGMPYQNGMGTWNISVKDIQICDGTSTWSASCVAEDVILDESYRGNHATMYEGSSSLGATYYSDFTSNTSWDEQDSAKIKVDTSDERLEFDIRRDTSNDSISKNIVQYSGESSICETECVVRFDMDVSTFSAPAGGGVVGFFGLGDSSSSTASNTAQDFIGLMTRHSNSEGEFFATAFSNSALTEQDSCAGACVRTQIGANDILGSNGSPTTDTYSVEIKRTSATSVTISIWINDTSFSGSADLTQALTITTAYTGFDEFVIKNTSPSSSSISTYLDGYIDNLKIWNGATSVSGEPLHLSLDSSLNMEGTNSAVFDGSSDYMTLPSDNTIIPTSSAFMMGANIKPDKIIPTPDTEDMSSDTFSHIGSNSISSNVLNFQADRGGTFHKSIYDFGSNLGSDWTIRFEKAVSSFTAGGDNYYWTGMSSSSSAGGDDTQNFVGIMWRGEQTTIQYCGNDGASSALDTNWCDGDSGDISGSSWTSDGTQYFEIEKSGTSYTINRYSDNTYSTVLDSTTGTTANHSDLRYFKITDWNNGSTAGSFTGTYDNVKIYNGVGNLDSETIFSYPTSSDRSSSVDFNIEGANLVFRSGDKGNDPVISSAHGMSAGTKYNVAVSRDGSNNFEIFVQGDRVGSVVSNSTALGGKQSGEVYTIGAKNIQSSGVGYNSGGFESATGWTFDTNNSNGAGTMYAQHEASLDRIEFKFGRDTDSTGAIYDIGEALPESWTLAFDYRITAQGTGYADQYWIGLSDQNDIEYSYGGNTGDHLLWSIDNTGDNAGNERHGISFEDNSDLGLSGNDKWQAYSTSYTTNDWYYVEIKRVDVDSASVVVRECTQVNSVCNTDGNVFRTHSIDTGSSNIDGLQYIIIANNSADTDNGQTLEAFVMDNMVLTSTSDGIEKYYDGKMDEFYVMTGQSDDTISNISSRSENVFTDRSYNTGGTGTTYSHTSISGGGGTYVAYRVSAHNSVGLSEYDLVLGQTANTPSAPQNLSIASTSPTVLTLDWDAPASQGASSISAYKVYRGTSSGFTLDSNSLVTTITDTSVTEYANSGLTADTRYYFSVLATNAQGDGTQANADAFTLLNAPTSLTATGVSTSQINLAWTAPSGANNLDGYKIEYNDGSWQNLVADTGGTGTTHSHTGLSTGNSFTYRVSGLNGSLAGLSSATAQGSTYAVPSAITDLSGTGLTGSSLRISWTAPSSTPALTGYMIEISEDNFSTSTTLESNTGDTDTSYDATGLSENVDYYFRVKAINSLGTASTSNIPTVQTGASQSGGGGSGGGGSPSFLPQFDELISLSVFGNAHKLTLGESIQDTLRLEWNSAEDLQVNEVIVGDNPFRFAVQKPPFIVLGDDDGLSNAEISYTIQVPNNYCTMDITVQCVEPDFYEVPVNVKVLSEGRTIDKNVVITVDLSSGFDPALFVILLVAGIASFGIYRISKGSSGRKKNGSVRKTVNSKPKGRKNGSVKKSLAL